MKISCKSFKVVVREGKIFDTVVKINFYAAIFIIDGINSNNLLSI
jgi:hypothetical protein